MSRKRPETRLHDLIECAARVFTERGYRRTQMADVARALGVAPGTLYLYVASKEALFDLVVQYGFRSDLPPPPQFPLPTPDTGTTLRHVRERFTQEMRVPQLLDALERRKPKDVRGELEGILRELYGTLARNWRGVKMLERSALDWPQLAGVYFHKLRRALIDRLAQYLQKRIRQGLIRPLPSAESGARLIIETVAWFAIHRNGDADPGTFDDAVAVETVVAVLVPGLIQEKTE